jgi:hypothetical protein
MTKLRRMMLEELQRRNYSAIATRQYLQVVTANAKKRARRGVTSPIAAQSRRRDAVRTAECWRPSACDCGGHRAWK